MNARVPALSPASRRSRTREVFSLLGRRALVGVPATAGITAAVFWLASLAPFNPLAQYLGTQYEHATPAQREALAVQLGLNDAWYAIWGRWIGSVVRGDWGTSRVFGQPVAQVLTERLPYTALLVGLGLLVAIALSVLLAVGAARRPGSLIDAVALGLVHLAQAIPPFVLGLVAIAVFAIGLGLPAGGASSGGLDPTIGGLALHLVLPVGVLAVTLLPWLVLNLRASMLEALESDAVLAARGRGLGEFTVLRTHVLPVALLPFITVLGSRLGELVTGALLVEAVFSWPGLASATVSSATAGDFPLLAAVTALTCAAVFAGSALADACYLVLDPRVSDV
ncbi:ABC transporter permease [Paeniglutamicibacter gangotriensis]|uniref:Oligopeptide ABC transporter permease n=1 Tax=Paeniglutamicibacter gangotriensis Lz1y TaxID=1276920 RepID=M7MPN3_9MICC|nr:ABC transporter permease [Paeniglutamicibacter gangotriensis]EMQ96905.1 oligopeptide ABC transporter permease [Paeniglutamicibacter gangotriensis Lz1y]